MSFNRPAFVNFSVKSLQWVKPVAIGNGIQWALPQQPARRKKSDLAKIKRLIAPTLIPDYLKPDTWNLKRDT